MVRVRTKVQAGGRVEVTAPELSPGQDVEVTVAPLESTPRRSILEILAECGGMRHFKTVEEVDAYINQERDSWER